MISTIVAQKILNTQYKNTLNKISGSTDLTIIKHATNAAISTLNSKCLKIVAENKIGIIFAQKPVINTIKDSDLKKYKAYGYSLVNKNEIHLVCKPELKPIEKVQYTVDNLLHEIGHFVFLVLIQQTELKTKIDEFIENSNKEGAVSLLAKNYLTEAWGRSLRDREIHLIQGVDIKYHEQFAELFRLFHECQLSNTKIESVLPRNVNKLITIFNDLIKC